MSETQKPIELFCSYAPEDEFLLKKLETHLSMLKRQGLVATWHGRKIIAGTDWAQAIDTHLGSASVILLLISPAFLASDYCYGTEMMRALERHRHDEARVIPVLLRPVDWHGAPFAHLQALPTNAKPVTTWSDRDQAFVDVATGIRRAIGDLGQLAPHEKPVRIPNGAGNYQIGNQGTVLGQVIGDNPTVHQHFYGMDASASVKREHKEIQKIKVLFLAANPTSTPRFALDEEMRAIEQKVRAAEHRDALVFQSAWAVRADDLLQLLNQYQPHIVHFSGHGSSQGLCVAGDNGQERFVTAAALKSLFTTLKKNIRLVFLNACYSREQAIALVETIDGVIGMKKSIGDNTAIAFASSFYRAVGFGRSLQEAFDQGRTSLLLEGIPEVNIPELLVREGVDAKKVLLIAPENPE
jgi:hypothetical protein